MDIDGYQGMTILDAKYAGEVKSSPYIPGASCPDAVRASVLEKTRKGLEKARTIIRTGATPFKSVEIITNTPESKSLFEGMLKEMGIPGTVRLAI